LVNAAIQKDYAVSFQEMPVQQAFDQGVIGMFPDRYDDVIKVYTIGDPAHTGNANPDEPTFSREICGGPHVEHTGVLGQFKITKEESSSAGIRRIKAVLT
jgi:alanyl-tRNA synthetase